MSLHSPGPGWPMKITRSGALDAAFPHLNEEAREAIKRGSQRVDKDQSIKSSFQHAMRAPGQSVDDAREKTEKFVSEKFGVYHHEMESGKTKEAYEALGEAMHPVMDSTSPAHEGFQAWEGLSHLFETGRHVLKEWGISEEQLAGR